MTTRDLKDAPAALTVIVDERLLRENGTRYTDSPTTASSSVSPNEWTVADPSRGSLYERLFGKNGPPLGACADTQPNGATETATPVVGDFSSLWESAISEMTGIRAPLERGFLTPTPITSTRESSSVSPEVVPMYLRDRSELTSDKLAEIRAKDAERKRRWRQKRRMGNGDCEKSPEEEGQLDDDSTDTPKEIKTEENQNMNNQLLSPISNCTDGECSTVEGAPRKRRERRPSTRRAEISPDRLQKLRAKDAERKRRARLRKRILTDALVDDHSVSTLCSPIGSSLPDGSSVSTASELSARRILNLDAGSFSPVAPKEEPLELEDIQNGQRRSSTDSLQSISTIVADNEQQPSDDFIFDASKHCQLSVEVDVVGDGSMDGLREDTASGSGSHSSYNELREPKLSPGSLLSPRSTDSRNGRYKIPRKALPPDVLQEVRAKDNARKREQRARRRQEKQLSMASTLLQMMVTANSNTTDPGPTIAPVSAALPSPSRPSVVQSASSSSFNSPSSFHSLHSPTPSLSVVLPSPSTTSNSSTLASALSVDVACALSPCVGGSAPASLFALPSGSETAALEIFKNIVEQARVHFSPRTMSEERAASKRAARAARMARMSDEEKKALRASDRERKRLWRQRRKQDSQTSEGKGDEDTIPE